MDGGDRVRCCRMLGSMMFEREQRPKAYCEGSLFRDEGGAEGGYGVWLRLWGGGVDLCGRY
jgi:hypothetical protein